MELRHVHVRCTSKQSSSQRDVTLDLVRTRSRFVRRSQERTDTTREEMCPDCLLLLSVHRFGEPLPIWNGAACEFLPLEARLPIRHPPSP